MLTPQPHGVGVAAVAAAVAEVEKVACTHCKCIVAQDSTNSHAPHLRGHDTAAASHSHCTPALHHRQAASPLQKHATPKNRTQHKTPLLTPQPQEVGVVVVVVAAAVVGRAACTHCCYSVPQDSTNSHTPRPPEHNIAAV
jgi:hypothetical protein